jgi:serine/threonine protein kinase
VAIKYVPFPQSVYQDDDIQRKLTHLKREIQTFRALSTSPNIVDFYGLCLSDGHLLMCMELMDTTLRKFYKIVHSKPVEATTPVFPEKILGFITVKVLDALAYCKNLNIIHRDVKPDNILLNLNGSIKLCDFGESRYLESKQNF